MFKSENDRDSIRNMIQASTDFSAHKSGWDWDQADGPEHFVQFYETDLFLLNSLAGFVSTGLERGEICIAAATEDHLAGVDARLLEYGIDADRARASGQYIWLEAAQTLSKFMVDGSPEPSRFADAVCKPIEQAISTGGRVRVFDELVALLWSEGNHSAALQLEELWNKLHNNSPFSLFCAYPLNGFVGGELAKSVEEVYSAHTKVIPAESYNELADSDGHRRAVLKLQQKAKSLEFEIAARESLQRQLQISETLYRKHCDAIGDGLIILDPDTQKITDLNDSAKRLFGTDIEFAGKELWEIGLFPSVESSRKAFMELQQNAFVRFDHLEVKQSEAQGRFVELVGSLYSYEKRRLAQFQIRDTTERKNTEQIASHLAAIVESSDDAIISKTVEGIILTWNKGAERIFGYTSQEVIGKSVLILIPPEKADEEPIILDKLKRGERIDHYETIRVAKNGSRLNISLTISPIRDGNGQIVAVSKIARDITEQKRIENEREQLLVREQLARSQAETANRMKDEFLATVSHELRTPLNAIIGWSHLLTSGRIDGPTAARAIETIERNARSQAQLIEDILDVSRVISGKLRLKLGNVDLASVINAAIDSVQLAADSKDIHFAITLDPSVRRIMGDAGRLQQVVWNLLSNAIKFTHQGGLIEVRLDHVDSQIQISVSDNGPGISAEFLPYVFDRFRQADGSSTRRSGGLGLGLAIVRHLIELHGGTVLVESTPGQGATFTLCLPAGKSEERTPEQGKDSVSMRSFPSSDDLTDTVHALAGIRILLVDDDTDNLNIIKILLTNQGASVLAVTSVAEALQVLNCDLPDVLVSDLAMPGEDGYVLIETVRTEEQRTGRHLPAIALTAYVRVADRAQALSRGFDMFVPKPVEPRELITAIAGLAEARPL
jgi:PAS domain S-box-containing protein